MRRLFVAGFVMTFALGVVTTAGAHQDYLGDVYPTVSTDGDRFLVNFTDNREGKAYRTIVDRSGHVLKERLPTKRQIPVPPMGDGRTEAFEYNGDWYLADQMPMGSKCGQKMEEDGYLPYEKAAFYRGHDIVRVDNGKVVWRATLPWGRDIERVHDLVVTDAHLVFLAQEAKGPCEIGGARPDGLAIYWFDRLGKKLVRRAPIPDVDWLMSTPTISNLAAFAGAYAIAWRDSKEALWLATFEGEDLKPTDLKLRSKIETNTLFSVAAIGRDLLIAHHGPGSEGFESKIHLIHHELRAQGDDADQQTAVGSGLRVSGPRGALKKEVVRRVISRGINDVRACWEATRARANEVGDRMTVRFGIGPSGRVRDAKVLESNVRDEKLRGCVLSAVRAWSFPAPEGGGSVVVTYPFIVDVAGG